MKETVAWLYQATTIVALLGGGSMVADFRDHNLWINLSGLPLLAIGIPMLIWHERVLDWAFGE